MLQLPFRKELCRAHLRHESLVTGSFRAVFKVFHGSSEHFIVHSVPSSMRPCVRASVHPQGQRLINAALDECLAWWPTEFPERLWDARMQAACVLECVNQCGTWRSPSVHDWKHHAGPHHDASDLAINE